MRVIVYLALVAKIASMTSFNNERPVSGAQDNAMTDRPASNTIFTAMLYGALLGGAAMAWLLLAPRQRDRLVSRQRRMLHMPRMADDDTYEEETVVQEKNIPQPLEDRMSQIQSSIEDVRRQLEAMGNDG